MDELPVEHIQSFADIHNRYILEIAQFWILQVGFITISKFQGSDDVFL